MLLLLLLLPLTSSNKIGLLLNSEESALTTALEDVSQFTLNQLGSDVTLVTRSYGDSYMSLMKALCGLIADNVVAVVSASTSTLTSGKQRSSAKFLSHH